MTSITTSCLIITGTASNLDNSWLLTPYTAASSAIAEVGVEYLTVLAKTKPLSEEDVVIKICNTLSGAEEEAFWEALIQAMDFQPKARYFILSEIYPRAMIEKYNLQFQTVLFWRTRQLPTFQAQQTLYRGMCSAFPYFEKVFPKYNEFVYFLSHSIETDADDRKEYLRVNSTHVGLIRRGEEMSLEE